MLEHFMLYRDIIHKLYYFIETIIDSSKDVIELTKVKLKTKNYDENK